MVSREYVGDYEVREEYNPRTGKTREVAEYVGPWFSFVNDDRRRQIKWIYIGFTALCQVCFWPMLMINARCGHIWYSMSPIVFMVLPNYYLLCACIRLITAKDQVIREHRDKIVERYPKYALILLGLCGLALAGHIAYSIIWGDTPLDLLFYGFTLAEALGAGLIYFKKDLIAMRMLDED